MTATLRAKFRAEQVLHQKNSAGQTDMEIVKLRAVSSDSEENKQWSKWTPSGNIEMQINNPSAIGKLSSGHEYYIDFIPVEQSEVKA